ncbi:Guanine deaminase [hydrothermal vent metagenome]|uniref:Guanine deaminase n=1 Tax=hydrothermal vent metagenome TaxID=652676 RepID=A0A1W1CUF1_9ZZZZ
MDHFMHAAMEEAKKGIKAGDGGPFGAVIVKEGKIIAAAHNEVIKSNDPTAHAEIMAIRKASSTLRRFSLEGCTLYVTGEPCPMCFSAIHWAHIDKVYYCNTKADAAKIGFDDSLITQIILGKQKDPISFIHTPNQLCQALFTQWYEAPDKVPY